MFVASAMHLARLTELAANQVNEVAALLQLPLKTGLRLFILWLAAFFAHEALT
jgi:hypothetical protein